MRAKHSFLKYYNMTNIIPWYRNIYFLVILSYIIFASIIYIIVQGIIPEYSNLLLLGNRAIYYLPMAMLIFFTGLFILEGRFAHVKIDKKFINIWLCFAFSGIISAVFSIKPWLSIIYAFSFPLSLFLIMLFVGKLSVDDIYRLFRWGGAIIIICAYVSFYYLGGRERFGFELQINPNNLAFFVSIAFASILFSRSNLYFKIIAAAGAIFILFTGSRSGLLATIASALIYFVINANIIKKKLFLLIFVAGVFGFAIIYSFSLAFMNIELIFENIAPTKRVKVIDRDIRLDAKSLNTSIQDRIYIAKIYTKTFELSLFGEGPRISSIILGRVAGAISHNSFLSILYDYGIIGFIIYIFGIMYVIYKYIYFNSSVPGPCLLISINGINCIYQDTLLSHISPAGILICIALCAHVVFNKNRT